MGASSESRVRGVPVSLQSEVKVRPEGRTWDFATPEVSSEHEINKSFFKVGSLSEPFAIPTYDFSIALLNSRPISETRFPSF